MYTIDPLSKLADGVVVLMRREIAYWNKWYPLHRQLERIRVEAHRQWESRDLQVAA